MFFNEAGYEVLLHYERQARQDRDAVVLRERRARHPMALWLAEHMLRTGARLRAWSAPEPICQPGTRKSHA